jgi:hypothetical protein
MRSEDKAFIIQGRICDIDDRRGISGLTVEAVDKDLLFDDRLGSTITDSDGRFEIRYEKSDFQEIFFEQKPDIYIQIRNTEGEIIHTTEDKILYESSRVEEYLIEIPRGRVDYTKLEHARSQFKTLIKLNPNYFGTAQKEIGVGGFNQVLAIQQNINYEELVCVGLYPEDDLLEAVLEVKLPYGFGTDLCGMGSKEYVAFYIDYGSGWTSAGPAAHVGLHNLIFANEDHLYYAVRRSFVPADILKCTEPQIVKVRAILSWESLPTGPDYIPVWGNVKEVWVQIRPSVKVKPGLMTAEALPQQLDMIDPSLITDAPPLPLPFPKPLFSVSGEFEAIKEMVDKTVIALEEESQSGKVEVQRLDFINLVTENPNYFGSISMASDEPEFHADIAKLPSSTLQYLANNYALNLSEMKPVFPQNPKTKYEELTCVGLYPEEDLLEAIIEVKLSYGYNGDLCTFGSWEYVAFYIDWGTGSGWDYIDTARVRVHNIPEAADKVLHYGVQVRIQNIIAKLKACEIENIVKVRAVLSWNQDPTPYGEDYTPAWGNHLEKHIQIRPIDGASAVCDIELVNEVHVDEISQSGSDKGYAYDPSDTIPPLTYNRPFGGVVAVWGNVNICGAVYYRLRFSENNGTTWSDVLDPRTARNPSSWFPTITRTPVDSDGWFSISEYDTDLSNYSLTPLIHWRSHGKNGEVVLKLELADATKSVIFGQSYEVTVHLDNKGIAFYEFKDTPVSLPMSGVAVKDAGGNFKKCDTFLGNEVIKVYGNFDDEHFRNFTVRVAGGNIATGGHPVADGSFDAPVPGIYDAKGIVGAADNTDGKEIASFDLCSVPQSPLKVKCAYSIVLKVWDRSIVGYLKGHGYEYDTTRHGRTGYVTFDWDPNGVC